MENGATAGVTNDRDVEKCKLGNAKMSKVGTNKKGRSYRGRIVGRQGMISCWNRSKLQQEQQPLERAQELPASHR